MARLALLLALVSLGLGCRSQSHSDDNSSRIETLERENAALRRQLDVLEARLNGSPAGTFLHTIGPPSIDALVLDVKGDLRLVVIDKGSESGVEVGYVFDVYRGSTYKGMIRIQDVQRSMSAGAIVCEKAKFLRGDSAIGAALQHSELEQTRKRSEAGTPTVCAPAPPLVDGLVRGVDADLQRIVIEKTSGAEVKAGLVLDVYRASTYKGFVRAVEVHGTMITCEILSQKVRIEPGDSATTQL